MTDDRSERLRQRRKQSANKLDAEGEEAEVPTDSLEKLDKPSKPTRTSQPSQASNDEETAGEEDQSVKERQTGTYMYLPEGQVKDLQRMYNVLKAKYEYEYEENFEKNRHFYPLVIQYGLDGLDSMDSEEIHTRLQDLP